MGKKNTHWSPVLSLAYAKHARKHSHYAVNFQEVVCNFSDVNSPSLPQNILTLLSIFIITWWKSWRGKKRNNSSSEALHTCRWWKARRVQQKNPPQCFFPSRWLPPLCCRGQRLSQEAAVKQSAISGAAVAFYGWSKVREMIKYTYSLFFCISPHPLCISVFIINAQDWEVWKWISGEDKKRRDSESERRKNNVEGSNMSERGREKSHGERRDCVRLAWHLLNISITDWVAIKMLLIQTPKDFYKTSISLNWLQHRGIHHGK